jgi:hypothetical protein
MDIAPTHFDFFVGAAFNPHKRLARLLRRSKQAA